MVSSRSLALYLLVSTGTSFHVQQGAQQDANQQPQLSDEVTLLQHSAPARQQTQQETAAALETEAAAAAALLETEAEEDPMARVEAVIDNTEVSQLEVASSKDAQHTFPMKDEWQSTLAASAAAYQAAPMRESFFKKLAGFYTSSLEVAPHLTNAVGAFIITTMGDAAAQIAMGPWKAFDVKRNLALAFTASMYNGMVLTTWLIEINRRLPGTEFRIVMGKLAATQTFLQPFVYVPFFFIIHGFLRGQSFSEIRSRFTSDYFALLFRLWSLFMPTRFMMFWIVPVRYQVLWDSSVAFIWQVALSLFNAKNRDKEAIACNIKKSGTPFLLKTRAFGPPAAEGVAAVQAKTEHTATKTKTEQ